MAATKDAEPNPGKSYFGPAPKETDASDAKALTKEQADLAETNFEKSIGVSVKGLKAKFDKPDLQFDDLTKTLINRIRDLIQGGIKFSLSNWRVYAAIDEAYNVSYQQINPTLIRKIISRRVVEMVDWNKVVDEFQRWGLDAQSYYSKVQGEDSPDKYFLKEETFWKIFIPLVKSYLTIRLAKIYNDRNQYPFLKYEPNKFTDEQWLIGEILTELVERIVRAYGYRAIFKQAIHQMLKYGFCAMFPVEAWHIETTADTDGNGEHATKEGLRYNIPHPTHVAWDLNYRPATFLTDTGCEWACYWNVYRYKDVTGNPFYWRKNQITASATNWLERNGSYHSYFYEIFPCTMQPLDPSANAEATKNREAAAAYFYQNSDHDKAVFLTNLFLKLTPKEWGLGDYPHPIWFRFLVANDDCVVYAEPLAYCPVLYMDYDADQNQPRNASMGLELMAPQDMIGNLMSQWIISLKQNLKQIIAFDKKAISRKDIEESSSMSNNVEKTLWMGFDVRQLRAQDADPNRLFFPVNLPRHDLSQFAITLDKFLTITERMLNMSAAETGAAGVHIQTAEEMKIIATNVTNRVNFTAASVDDFVDAWKRQIQCAARAYVDREYVVEVNNIEPTALQKIGFVLVGEQNDSKKIITIKGKLPKVAMESYISSREFMDRINDPQVAAMLMQNLAAFSKSPAAAAIPPEQWVDAWNRVLKLMGGPRDFKWRSEIAKPEVQAQGENPMQAMMQQIAQLIQQQVGQSSKAVMDAVMKNVSDGLQPLVQAIQKLQQDSAENKQVDQSQQENLDQMAQIVLKLDGLLKAASQAPAPPAIIPPQPQPIEPAIPGEQPMMQNG